MYFFFNKLTKKSKTNSHFIEIVAQCLINSSLVLKINRRPRIRFFFLGISKAKDKICKTKREKDKGLRIKGMDAEAQGLRMRSNLLVEQSIQTSNHEN